MSSENYKSAGGGTDDIVNVQPLKIPRLSENKYTIPFGEHVIVLPDGRKIKLNIAAFMDIGGLKEQQDSVIYINIQQLLPGYTGLPIIIWGIADGHGNLGKRASNFLIDFLTNFFVSNIEQMQEESSIKICVSNCFREAHNSMREHFKKIMTEEERHIVTEHLSGTDECFLTSRANIYSVDQLVQSGSTLTLSILVGFNLYSANVADSDSILGTNAPVLENKMCKFLFDAAIPEAADGAQESIKTDTLQLNTSHSPEDIEEYKRVIGDGTLSNRLSFEFQTYPNGALQYINLYYRNSNGEIIKRNRGGFYKNKQNTWATLVKGQIGRYLSSLAFTRSIGDHFLHQLGLTYRPIIKVTNLLTVSEACGHKLLFNLVASDGVWDNQVSINYVTEFIMEKYSKTSDVESIISAIMNKNETDSRENFGSSADNSSGILVLFTIEL